MMKMEEKILYISRMQAKQLLNNKIKRVERTIPKRMLETEDSIKFCIELSD